eukprot:1645638-Rhodomonas_salina.1
MSDLTAWCQTCMGNSLCGSAPGRNPTTSTRARTPTPSDADVRCENMPVVPQQCCAVQPSS